MGERLRTDEVGLLLAGLLLSAALLWLAVSEPFDIGYRHHAERAAKMLSSGDWVVQRHADGRPYFDKPPLLTWVVAGVARFTKGPISWEQHVPGLLAWGLTLVWTGLFARRWFGTRRAALTAALVLGTTLGFPSLIRTKRLDPMFGAFTTGAVYYGYLALVSARPGRRGAAALGAWLLAALAALTKGPLGLVFGLAPTLVFAVWTRRLRRLATVGNGIGALACVGLLLVWPLLLIDDLGLSGLLKVLGDTDFTTRHAGPFYYWTDGLGHMLPWVLFLPAIVGWLGQRGSFGTSDAVRLPACWTLVVFVPLQFSSAKHHRYLLPAYPAFALLVTALFYDEALRGWARRWRDGVLGVLLVAFVGVGLAAPLAAVIAGERSPIPPAPAAVLGLTLALFGWLGWVALRRRAVLRAYAFAVSAAALAWSAEMVGLAETYRGKDETAVVEQAFIAPIEAGLDARTFALDSNSHSLALIATRRRVDAVASVPDLVDWLEAQPEGRGVLMTTPSGAAAIESEPRLRIAHSSEVRLDGDPILLVELTLAG